MWKWFIGVVILSCLLFIGAASASAQTTTAIATADAPVASAWPTQNYGAHNRLIVNLSGAVSSATRESYVKFNVALPAGATVTAARLRLYAANTSAGRTDLYRVGNAWTEAGLTWANRPVVSSPILSSDVPSAVGWREMNVPADYVTAGENSYALKGGNSTTLSQYQSREDVNDPQLVVTYSTEPTPTPTPTPSPTATPTPTPPPSGTMHRLATQGRNTVSASTGQNVILRGVQMMNSEYRRSMANERTSIPAFKSQWGGNVISRGFASDPINARDATYLSWMDEYVSLTRANRLYMEFRWRSHTIDGPQPDAPNASATSALTFLANRYRNEPHVIFALQEEPHGTATWSNLRPVFEQMIDSIRGPSGSGLGNQPLIMVPGMRWGHDVRGALTNPVNRPNVVYKTHVYGDANYWSCGAACSISAYNDFQRVWDAGLPVKIGEQSNAPELGSDMNVVNTTINYVESQGMGASWWIYDTCACGQGGEDLLANWLGAPTSPYGTTIQAHLRRTPPLP